MKDLVDIHVDVRFFLQNDKRVKDNPSLVTNVKDLVYIHVGASEMLHFVTNDEFAIVITEWIFRRKWALSMTNDFSQFISD